MCIKTISLPATRYSTPEEYEPQQLRGVFYMSFTWLCSAKLLTLDIPPGQHFRVTAPPEHDDSMENLILH